MFRMTRPTNTIKIALALYNNSIIETCLFQNISDIANVNMTLFSNKFKYILSSLSMQDHISFVITDPVVKRLQIKIV